MSEVILVAADFGFEDRARLLLADDLVVMAPGSVEKIVSRIIRLESRPELIVLGAHMPSDQALEIASAVRHLCDGLALVTIAPKVSPAAAASGVTEVITPNADFVEMDSLFQAAKLRSQESDRTRGPHRAAKVKESRTIVVTSPKGGVGKTTVACNLAMGLAAKSPDDVVIVDLDLQFGDVATALRLDPLRSVEDAVSRSGSRDISVLKLALTRHSRGLLALCAPPTPAAADLISPAQIVTLLRQLEAEYSYVVIDTSPGLSEHTLAVLERATDMVSVTSMDLSSARGLVKEHEVLRELDLLPSARQVLLNLADRAVGMTKQDVEHVVGEPIDIVVPRSRAVALGTNTGIPVVSSSPRDPAAKALGVLIQRMHGETTRKNWWSSHRKEKIA